MNNTKKLRSALLSSLTIIASIVLGHTAQAAVRLYFEPTGDPPGGGGINRHFVGPNKKIDFNIFIDTTGEPFANITQLHYQVSFDPKELLFKSIGKGNDANVSDKETLADAPITVFKVWKKDINIAKAMPQVHITTISFATLQIVNDGKFDFKIENAQGLFNDGRRPDFIYGVNQPAELPQQEVELREVPPKLPEPTSILGLFSLGIIGVGATIKRQVKRNHSIEKETTEIG